MVNSSFWQWKATAFVGILFTSLFHLERERGRHGDTLWFLRPDSREISSSPSLSRGIELQLSSRVCSIETGVSRGARTSSKPRRKIVTNDWYFLEITSELRRENAKSRDERKRKRGKWKERGREARLGGGAGRTWERKRFGGGWLRSPATNPLKNKALRAGIGIGGVSARAKSQKSVPSVAQGRGSTRYWTGRANVDQWRGRRREDREEESDRERETTQWTVPWVVVAIVTASRCNN